MQLANENEATQFLQESMRAYEPMLHALGRQVGMNRCMMVGRHWLTDEMFYKFDALGRHPVNLNPDTNKLRVVRNRIPRFIHEVAAATFPDMIEYDVRPPDRDVGPEASMRAQVLESALITVVDGTGFLNCARTANYLRCIDGLHGIGVTIKNEKRSMGDYAESDCVLKAFTFDAHHLVLDPFNQSLDLWDHEYVIYREVWTVTKIQRELGVKLDPSNLKSVGQLMPMELGINRVSGNRLYKQVREFSETKGAIVSQMHVKDPSGRFGTMLVGIDTGEGETRWINWDNQESPFGGNGLPLMLLHGYREPDSLISQSDVALLKDDQDNINLMATMFARIHSKQAGFQWVVQEGSLAGDGADDAKSNLRNYVGGVVFYKPGTRERPTQPPQLVQYPTPQPYLQEAISLHQERDMPSQIHRPQITAGATKSHVPDSTFQSALLQAGQVLGNRQREDTYRYEEFGRMLLGTQIKLVQQGSPSALVQLRRDGFDGTDFAVLEGEDSAYPACTLRLTERSIRYRSTEQKEQSLNEAAKLQMISAEDYALAKAALDAPLTEQHRLFDTHAKKWAMRVLLGEEWIPRSLGKATPFFVDAFQNAMHDRRAEQDPAAMTRLNNAVSMMLAFANQERQMAVAAEQPPATDPAMASGAEGQQQMPQEVNIADLLTSLNGDGGSQSAQPTAA